MILSYLFWIALALPGYVTVRHVWRDDVDSGVLGVVALSYLAVFGLLTPVSLIGYFFSLPLIWLSGACVVLFVASAVEVARRGWWRDLGKLLVGGLGVGLLIVVGDMVMGAMVGSHTGGDAALHMARIRELLEHGFNNRDPFVAGDYFFATYHTNLFHALHAVCAQITGVHHVHIWFFSIVWAKLLVAAGAYYMAWSVFDRRWVAWVAVAFVVGCQGPVSFVVYPNKLAPFWVLPMMVGFAVRAVRSPCTWRSPLKLAVGSLVLGQLHCLYGAFAALALGPVLVGAVARSLIRRRSDRMCLALCVASLAAALPFLVVSKRTSLSASSPSTQAGTDVKREPSNVTARPGTGSFHYFDNGWLMMKPRWGWGIPTSVRSAAITACLVVGIACGYFGPRRKEVLLLLAMIGTVVLILRMPPFCAVALRVFQREWIVGRMSCFLYLGFVGLVPASIACLLESKTRFWWVRSLVTVAVALLAALAFGGKSTDRGWSEVFSEARAPRERRHAFLESTDKIVDFCREHIPTGATVLIEDFQGMVLVSVHDCHIVAPYSTGGGVTDIGVRRRDLRTLLALDTPWSERRELLRAYDIKYFFPAGAPVGWVRDHLKGVHRFGERSALFVLDLDS